MIKFKELKSWLNSHDVKWWESDNGQYIYIQCCKVGKNNGWDYEEQPRAIKYDNEIGKKIKDDPRVKVLPCDYCCGCGGW